MCQVPVLSVIIPSYNMEQYLPKCLGSLIVAPTLMEKMEVLVVNDGSKDRTSEIAHEYVAKWPGMFNVIDKANGHYGSCINAALPEARGEYVKILDADDWFDTTAFERFLTLLQEFLGRSVEQRPDLVLTDYDKVDAEGNVLIHLRQPFEEGPLDVDELFSKAAKDDYYLAMHGVAYRRDILVKTGYRQSEGVPYTDSEWVLYPMAAVKQGYCLHVNLYRYLLGREGQTMSSAFRAEASRSVNTVIQKRLVQEYGRYMKVAILPFQEYFQKTASDLMCIFYSRVILGKGTVEFDGGIDGFEMFFKETTPAFYEFLDNVYVVRLFRFRLIHAWRNHARGSIAFFSLWARLYTAFLLWRHGVKMRCRKLIRVAKR